MRYVEILWPEKNQYSALLLKIFFDVNVRVIMLAGCKSRSGLVICGVCLLCGSLGWRFDKILK